MGTPKPRAVSEVPGSLVKLPGFLRKLYPSSERQRRVNHGSRRGGKTTHYQDRLGLQLAHIIGKRRGYVRYMRYFAGHVWPPRGFSFHIRAVEAQASRGYRVLSKNSS